MTIGRGSAQRSAWVALLAAVLLARIVASVSTNASNVTCKQGWARCGTKCVANASPKLCGGRCVTTDTRACTAPQARCTPCAVPRNGKATCPAARKCGFACNTGFVAVNGTCQRRPPPKSPPPPPPPPPSPVAEVSSTFYGLQAVAEGTRVDKDAQLASYARLAMARDRVLAALASASRPGNTTLTRDELLQAACGSSTVCDGYLDVLLLLLSPTTYSSNSTQDTGGLAFISPAQDQRGCAACIAFAGVAAAEAAIAVTRRQDWSTVGLSEQDLAFCRMSRRVVCSTGSNYADLVDTAVANRLQQWAPRQEFTYRGSSAGTNCERAAALPTAVPTTGSSLVGCFQEPSCDNTYTRALALISSSDKMTVEMCANLARLRGYAYAAVQWSRECYGGSDISQYVTPGTCNMTCNGNPAQICGGNCTSSIYAVKTGGSFAAVDGGNALESMARIKQQIMLNGGVMTSMVVFSDFENYPNNGGDIYSNSARVNASAGVNLHAVYCYGWNDTGAYWLCKNSWSPGWGLDGSFKIAYGSAYIMPPDYTFGLAFVRADNDDAALQQLSRFSTPDAQQAGCYTYSPPAPARLLQVAHELSHAWTASFVKGLVQAPRDLQEIIEDLLLSNTAVTELRGGSTGFQHVRICGASAGVLAPITTELDALLAVKAAIDPLNQVLTGWTRAGGANAAYCRWEGITCSDDGAVNEIVLVDMKGLGGVMPSAAVLQGLPRLTQLWLQDCGLGGELPAVLPPSLLTLALGANSIAGTVPDWSSTTLEEVYVWGNRLSGTLPPWQRLQSLVSLGLSINALTGPLPASWGPSVSYISLWANRLSGELPSAWAQMQSLRFLDVSINSITGSLPSAWAVLGNLEELRISSNNITGPLPGSWRSLTKLQKLVLWSNKLDGELPAWLGDFPLKVLYLSNNALVGTLPPELGKLSRMTELYLDRNKFAGPVPAEWSGMVSLTLATLWNNPGLTGCLPAAWQGRVNVEGSSYSLDDLTYGTGITGFCPAPAAAASAPAAASVGDLFTKPASSSSRAGVEPVAAHAPARLPHDARAPAHHDDTAPPGAGA